MSLLTIIQDFCDVTGLPIPTSVYGTTDTQVSQVRAILEEEGRDLSKRGAWQGITYEATLTTTAAEDQGAMSTIASNGFNYIKKDTFWDRTDRLPIIPMNDGEWQTMKAIVTTGPRYRFRIRGGKLLLNPTPSAGHTLAFEYASKNWILGADGVTYKRKFTLDTDEVLLPEELMLMGLRWRWKKEKGLDYAEDFATYESQVKDALGRDGAKQTLHMDHDGWTPRPGVFVPQGSWNLP
jgi:hypothetical protein